MKVAFVIKNYSVIVVFKDKDEVNSVSLIPAIFCNETAPLRCSIFVLKTLMCKTLIDQTKTATSMGIK